MKSAGKARNNGLYRHIRTSKEIIRNLLNDYIEEFYKERAEMEGFEPSHRLPGLPHFECGPFSLLGTSPY